jgi:fatty acid elongase 2/fatty acid elongase 3
VYFATYTYFTSTYFTYMPHVGKCAGEEFAAIAGCAILSSYLLLFISFYFATYKKTGAQGRKRRNTATKAVVTMARTEVPSVNGIAYANGSAKANGNGHVHSNGHAHSSARSNGPTTRSRKA